MRRELKYPDTATFHFCNVNPKNKYTTDCVIRAITAATELDYNKLLIAAAVVQIETGYGMNSSEGINAFMQRIGWEKHKQPRKDDGTKFTGEDWCNWLSINDPSGKLGAMVANIGGGHTVCIKPTNQGDGFNCRYKVIDTWNSTDGCIGNYWTKTGAKIENPWITELP